MMTAPSFSTNNPNVNNNVRPVAITSVDLANRMAEGITRERSTVFIDLSYPVGETLVCPAVGEGWYVSRTASANWRLQSQIPVNDKSQTLDAVAGQRIVGSGNGPVELLGTEIKSHASLSIPDGSTLILNGQEYRVVGGLLQQSVDDVWSNVAPQSTDDLPEGDNLWFTEDRAAAAAPVQSVAGRTGDVTVTKTDVGLSSVSDLAPSDLPVSDATTAVLDTKASQTALDSTNSTVATNTADITTTSTNLDSLRDGVYQSITGDTSTGVSQTQLNTAVDGMTDIIGSTAAAQTQIAAALSSGTPDADDFERTSSSSLGSLWTTYSSGGGGTLGTNGHEAYWDGSGSVDWIAKKTNVQAASDQQVVTIVFGSAPQTFPSQNAKNDLWVRMNNFSTWATRTGVRLRFDSNGKKLRLSSWNSGVETLMTEVSDLALPVQGTTMVLESGVNGDPRHFVCRLAGAAVIDWVETGTASLFDTNYRYRGFGGRHEQFGFVMAFPGTLQQWAAQG